MNLVWFRDDLRVTDNPALAAAVAAGGPVICLYILEEHKSLRPIGGAARWWLHHALDGLSRALKDLGSPLILRQGDPETIVPDLVKEAGVERVFWNRRYAPEETEVDARIKSKLKEQDLEVESYKANLLFEPWEVKTGSGDPYRVFTPFWKAARAMGEPDEPLPAPSGIEKPGKLPESDSLNDWALLPTKPDWAAEFPDVWTPGEKGAMDRLDRFIETALTDYKNNRDLPAGETTSMLSPHLRWGDISPRQIWSVLRQHSKGKESASMGKFLAELGWREFSKSLLFHGDKLHKKNWKAEFDDFPWKSNKKRFAAWSKGETGYPLVDAGMRQLWRTGWMHNRVRMVAASFLIKHLLIDWREGEAWFWDTLVDADAASNPASWQWVAGSGADAAPFFRIFNPIMQSEKFDPSGDYIREFVPELAKLDSSHIHTPWEAPKNVLEKAGIEIGETYPEPIVDHGTAREKALAAYQSLKD